MLSSDKKLLIKVLKVYRCWRGLYSELHVLVRGLARTSSILFDFYIRTSGTPARPGPARTVFGFVPANVE